MFNWANRITLARMAAVPLLVVLLSYPSRTTCLIAFILFVAASLTDLLDGYIARKYKLVSSFGKFLDPLADKLLVCTALIMLVDLGWVPAWVTVVIIGRELAITGLRAIAVEEGVVIAADRYGKIKTVLQVVALCPLILHYSWFGLQLAPLGMVLLYVATLLTVVSGGNYLYTFYGTWKGRAPQE